MDIRNNLYWSIRGVYSVWTGPTNCRVPSCLSLCEATKKTWGAQWPLSLGIVSQAWMSNNLVFSCWLRLLSHLTPSRMSTDSCKQCLCSDTRCHQNHWNDRELGLPWAFTTVSWLLWMLVINICMDGRLCLRFCFHRSLVTRFWGRECKAFTTQCWRLPWTIKTNLII